MKPSVGAIHELLLPMVPAIADLLNHTCIQQRPIFLEREGSMDSYCRAQAVPAQIRINNTAETKEPKPHLTALLISANL
jgi:hypothetical protein